VVKLASLKTTDIVAKLAAPVLEALGYELVGVEFIKEGSGWYLRIYIDSEGIITLDDCQAASERLSLELDRLDPVKQSYFLEVCSPGIDRPFTKDRDYRKHAGKAIEVKMLDISDFRPSEIIEGILAGLDENGFIVIKTEKGTELKIDKTKTAYVKRQIKF